MRLMNLDYMRFFPTGFFLMVFPMIDYLETWLIQLHRLNIREPKRSRFHASY